MPFIGGCALRIGNDMGVCLKSIFPHHSRSTEDDGSQKLAIDRC